jgi:hypothetical protein
MCFWLEEGDRVQGQEGQHRKFQTETRTDTVLLW